MSHTNRTIPSTLIGQHKITVRFWYEIEKHAITQSEKMDCCSIISYCPFPDLEHTRYLPFKTRILCTFGGFQLDEFHSTLKALNEADLIELLVGDDWVKLIW